jgi:hypothetical protein
MLSTITYISKNKCFNRFYAVYIISSILITNNGGTKVAEELLELIADGYVLTYAAIIVTGATSAMMVLRLQRQSSIVALPCCSEKIPLITKFITRLFPTIPIVEKSRLINF